MGEIFYLSQSVHAYANSVVRQKRAKHELLSKLGCKPAQAQITIHGITKATLFSKSVKYDRPGDCSSEKDCLWWHWLPLRQLSGSWLWWWLPQRLSKHQSMSTQTVLLRATRTQTIILNQLMIWLLGSNHLEAYFLSDFYIRNHSYQVAYQTIVSTPPTPVTDMRFILLACTSLQYTFLSTGL